MEKVLFKNIESQVKDLDEKKGIVQMYVNSFNIEDTDGDISAKGSFTKTIKENFERLRHLLNHDLTILLGLPREMLEDNFGLLATSQMNLKKQIVKDVYEDYKLFAENGRSLEHSVRVNPIQRDKKDQRIVTEWRLWEYSTLLGWGANSQTPVISLKRLADLDLMMSKGNYSDEKYEQIEMLYNKLKRLMEEPEALVDEPQPLGKDESDLIRQFYLKLKIN